jgi:hypothetical protein
LSPREWNIPTREHVHGPRLLDILNENIFWSSISWPDIEDAASGV